uniref:Uncharacterized protein n=1 Tax=Felis catus TaxID=9685 RepID=A0ABI7X1H7_FELCA
MANRHMERCSTSLIIREMHIKMTVICHLTPVRMAKISSTRNDRYWQGYRGRRTFLHCWWECKLVQPLWKRVWRLLKKLKIEWPYDLTIALLDIYPKDVKILIQKNTCTPLFIAASITARLWKQPKCPWTDEWIKMWYIYSMGYYAAIKRMKSCHLQ